MKFRVLFVLLAGISVTAAASELSLHGPPIDATSVGDDRIPRHVEEAFVRAIEANSVRLGLTAGLQQKNAAALVLPLRPSPPHATTDRHGISNFVDNNAAFPDFVRDYQCGARSYDTASGYNHRGTDFFTWPFSWQSMAQNAMQVRAAAGGVIVHRVDGNFDRNCSLDAPDTPNAIFVRHADGTTGWYLHFKRDSLISKQVGDSVEAGEVLGEIGSSGISTGPHLHFELRSASNQTIDPYNGQCNTAVSRWAVQPEYRDSRLLVVATHHAPPLLGLGCGEVEQPNYRNRFSPGERVYAVAYFRDLGRGHALQLELFRPDGSVFAQGEMDTSAMNADYFSAGYWYASVQLPEDAPTGIWRARYTYQGRSVQSRFAVGANGMRATGAWYDPAQSGQGLVMEVVDIGQAQALLAVSFYAYLDGIPVWMVGNGPLQGNSAVVSMIIGSGAEFPPDFDPQQVVTQPWGELQIQFTGPDSLDLNWQSPLPQFASGNLSMTRLTGLADINSDGFDSGLRACLSGSWYDPAQSGHGLQVQIVGGGSNRLAAVIWYAYRDGQPYWLNGAAPIPLDGRVVVAMEDASGGDFPPNFDPAAVQRTAWGDIELEASGPNSARLRWTTTREGFAPSGEINLRRLTQSIDATCR